MQCLLVVKAREQFELVALFDGRYGLVAGLELHLLAGAEKTDRLEGERGSHLASQPQRAREVYPEVDRGWAVVGGWT